MGGTNQDLEGRNGLIWRQCMVMGWTEERVAQEHGISQQRVSQIIQNVKQKLRPAATEELTQQSLEFLRAAQAEAWALVEKQGAPVAVGKDGSILYEPCDCDEYIEHGRCGHPSRIVRDYSLRLAAIGKAVEIDKSVRKLFGLDAPEKRELSGSVRYEIVGVDDDDLT